MPTDDDGPWHPAPAWVEPLLWAASGVVWAVVVWLIWLTR